MERAIRNILGPTIKFYRKRMGLTQEELTARLNIQGIDIDRPILSKIENQARELYDYEIYAMAKIFQIDYNDLFKDISK